MRIELVQHVGTEETICQAARVSTNAQPDEKRNAGLIKYLVRNSHLSPVEHVTLTFKIEAPIFVAREWMRHRSQSYNEASGRYRELEPNFYYPPPPRSLVQVGKAANYTLEPGTEDQQRIVAEQHEAAYTQAWASYQTMLKNGIAREVARNVLPVGLYTEWYATMNLRNALQFLDLRTAEDAQWEIRVLAQKMRTILEPMFPNVLEAWNEKD